MVVEERAATGVERGDGDHLVVAQREVEDVEVLFHAIAVRALRDTDHTALQQPAQHDLGDRLAVRLADASEDLVAEEVVSALRKGCPALHGYLLAGHILLCVALLEEHVALDLVHGGGDVRAMDCDFYAFSGHKLYGPTGIGVLYGKRELLERMPPFMGGGDMVDTVTFAKTTYAPVPLKFEAGTANFVGAIGLGEAVKFMQRFDPAEIEAHEEALLRRATERLEGIGGLRIYGTAPGKCAILSFNVEGVHPYDMGMILDKLGIAVRTGQHCAEPVMDHYGTTGMCRASFALYNTLAEADALAAGVERAVNMLRN